MVNIWESLVTAGPLHAMRSALDARLRLAFPPRLFAHAVLPAQLTMPVWAALTRRTPVILLGFDRVEPDNAAGRLFSGKAHWRVMPVVRNAGTPEARLLGDASGPGQLGVIGVAIAALHGMTTPAGTVTVTGATNLAIEGLMDEAAAPSGVTLSIPFTLPPVPASGDVDDFLWLAVDWRLDPAEAIAASDITELREDAA